MVNKKLNEVNDVLNNVFIKMALTDIEKAELLNDGEMSIIRGVLADLAEYKIECGVIQDGIENDGLAINCELSSYKVCTMSDECVLEFTYSNGEVIDVAYNLYPVVKRTKSFKEFRNYIFARNLVKCDLTEISELGDEPLNEGEIQLTFLFVSGKHFYLDSWDCSLNGLTPFSWWEKELNRYLANFFMNLVHNKIDYSILDNVDTLFIINQVPGYWELHVTDLAKLNRLSGAEDEEDEDDLGSEDLDW